MNQPPRSFYKRSLPSPPATAFSSDQGRQIFQEALEDGTMTGFFKLMEQFRCNEPSMHVKEIGVLVAQRGSCMSVRQHPGRPSILRPSQHQHGPQCLVHRPEADLEGRLALVSREPARLLQALGRCPARRDHSQTGARAIRKRMITIELFCNYSFRQPAWPNATVQGCKRCRTAASLWTSFASK